MQIIREPSAPSITSLHCINATAAQIRENYRERPELFDEYHRTHLQRLAFDLDMVRQHADPGDIVLDVGSTPLLFSGAVASNGIRVVGVDIDPAPFRQAANVLGLDLLACNIETDSLPVEDESIDLVVLNEVFEHLRINPIFTLSEIRRVLKFGGKLLLSTPNLKSLRGIVNFLWRDQAHSCCGDVYSQYAMLADLGHMGHTREYTRTEVCNFLRRSGFNVDACVCRGRFHSVIAHAIVSLWPKARPFMSLIAHKA